VSDVDLGALVADIAREAGDLAKRRRAEGISLAATKSTLADIVTEADREVERLIRDRLRAERPDDGFLGEETGADRGTSGLTWVVDPIDGTVDYAYGIASYSVSIAVVGGEPDPERWEWAAAAGNRSPSTGAFTAAATPCQCSGSGSPSTTAMLTEYAAMP